MPTINKRIEDLETRKPDLPVLIIWEDLEKPGLWIVNGESVTWAEVETRYANREIIKVVYVDDWRANDS